jgi:pimeloyl-ACP methyl ester carboxylesterase
MAKQLPIVYLRGFAGGTGGIDSQTDDPFYGFNAGATHVRQDAAGNPSFYQFPGPLLRLMQQWGYDVLVGGPSGMHTASGTALPAALGQGQLLDEVGPGDLSSLTATVWVHRFYDASADSWGASATPFSIKQAADTLLPFIQKILTATGENQVYLVAHSMGGLIARSFLQRTCTEQNIDAKALVRKVFTYATPHGGISAGFARGLMNWLTAELDIDGSAIFEPASMYDYLTPAAEQDEDARKAFVQNVVPANKYPVERMFSLIGTDNSDYSWLPAKYVGPQSDGLVRIENAFVEGSTTAYVHRSHSGRYGIVNSEEGYQNLQRFLFGDWRIKLSMTRVDLTPKKPERTFRSELLLSIRGLPVVMHERLIRDFSNYQLQDGDQDLLTTYIFKREDGSSRWSVKFDVVVEDHEHGFLNLTQHIQDVEAWSDVLLVDVDAQGFTYAWNSMLGGAPADTAELTGQPNATGPDVWEIPFPETAAATLGPQASIVIAIDDWSDT